MRFGNSIRLLLENFKQIYKLLLYNVIRAIVVGAICSVFVIPELIQILENPVTQELGNNFKNIFVSLVSSALQEPSVYVKMVFGENGNLKQFFDLIISMRVELGLAFAGCALVYLLQRFVDTLVYFTIGSTVNDKMSIYADTGFWTAFVANLGKASAYAFLYVPVVFVFDVATITLCFMFLRFLPLLAALFLSITLVVACQSVKLTFTSHWMPAMTADGKKLKEALRYGDRAEKRQIGKVFSSYVVTVYAIIIINVIAAICTFGSALLITIPLSYVLLICEQYVHYYTMKGKKYFITYDRIATNPDHGDSEHFFDYIEDIEEEKAVGEVVNKTEN